MDIKVLKRLRPGGTEDTTALLLAAAGFFVSNPALHLSIWGKATVGIWASALCGAHFYIRAKDAFGLKQYFPSKLKIRSSPPPKLKEGEKGFLLGYIVDTGEPLIVPMDDAVRHMSIVGQSGVGKTVFGTVVMHQQIGSGGGLVFMDGKLDSKTLLEIYRIAAFHGREHDVLVINPGDPSMSNLYNPIQYGDPDEVGDRIVGLIPSTDTEAGADHYKQSAKQAVTTLVRALKKTGMSYTFIDLVLLLSSPQDLTALEAMLPPCDEKVQLQIFLDQYRVPDKSGDKTIDMKRLKETFGGIGGRLYSFGTGSFGEVMNTVSPEIRLFEAMKNNKIIYVMMPTMGKPETASNFGKMFLGDARTSFSWLQKLEDHLKPNPPLLFFMDELGSYATPALSRPFEQNRSASVILAAAYQTYANLEAVSKEFSQMTLGNTWIKVFFKPGSQDTAEQSAEMIGMENTVMDSISMSGGQGVSAKAAGSAPESGNSENESMGFSEKQQETYKVSPDDIKALDKGEAIVTVGGDKLYHIRVPLISFSDEFKQQHPTANLNRFRMPWAKGIDLFGRAKKKKEMHAD